MTKYDKEVRELIGEGVVRELLENVDGGNIDQQTAEIFVEVLSQCDRGLECHCRAINGQFLNRTKEAKFKFDRNAFREILSDWYQACACDLSGEEAVQRLLNVLKHENLGNGGMIEKSVLEV